MLGDGIESALELVGITRGRVEAWVGGPCGCEERKQKLNALGYWAKRVVGGRVARAVEYLNQIMEQA